MKPRLRLLRPARYEIQDAFAYYRSKSPTVAQAFVARLGEAFDSILDAPTAWTPFGDHLRRRNLQHFPYSVIYAIDGDCIVVTGLMHLHSGPNKWREVMGRR